MVVSSEGLITEAMFGGLGNGHASVTRLGFHWNTLLRKAQASPGLLDKERKRDSG